jgi:hypothetical protein
MKSMALFLLYILIDLQIHTVQKNTEADNPLGSEYTVMDAKEQKKKKR